MILTGLVVPIYPQDHGLLITPVYQWTDNPKETPRFFLENQATHPLYKTTMFLKVGPDALGEYRYYPPESLKLLLKPDEEAMIALNNCGKVLKILTGAFFLAAIGLGAAGNWQNPMSAALPWYYGAGGCFAVTLICWSIPPVSNADRLRIIEMHNKALEH